MKLVAKPRGGRAKVLRDEYIHSVVSEGYKAISCSSRPPYGPRIKRHKAEVDCSIEHYALQDVRVMPAGIESWYDQIMNQIASLQKQAQQLLDDSFLICRLAEIGDFPPEKQHKGLSATEAKAQLPKGKEAEEAERRGRSLANILR